MATPEEAQVQARLEAARAALAQGSPLDAAQLLMSGLKLRPADPRLRQALAEALQGFPLDSAGPAVRAVLLDLCLDEAVAAQCLVDAIIGLARNSAAFPALLGAALAGRDLVAQHASELADFAGDELLAALLGRAVINDPELERVLTQLRRDLLRRGAPIAAVPFSFACALARQCFNTEYAFLDEGDPPAPAPALAESVDPATLEHALVLAAMAAPLHRLPGRERMLDWNPDKLSPAFRPIWQAQVADHRRERDLAAGIEALTPVADATSRAVQDQYEDSPYPRWLAVHRPRPEHAPGLRSILIAGCGTGQHPVHTALANPGCEVWAVDLSRSSLAYATRMAERYAVPNLRFRQADILELGAWPRRFDRIESLGVLHHMQDPVAGWRVLVGLLAPGGTMRIGLYSSRAREPLRAAREIIAAGGYSATPAGIRRARRAILDLPENHHARSVAWSDDFYSVSGCRDLLMHVREHSYTPAQIAACLELLGLQLHGIQAPPDVLAAFRSAWPQPGALTDLDLWDRFEQRHPEIFRGMIHFSCGIIPSPCKDPIEEKVL